MVHVRTAPVAFGPPRRRGLVMIGLAAVILGIGAAGTAHADPILNSLAKQPPYTYGWSNGGGFGPGGDHGHSMRSDDAAPSLGLMECMADVWVRSWLGSMAGGEAFSQAEIGSGGFECVRTGSFRLNARIALSGMAGLSVPDRAHTWGGAEAHLRVQFRLKVHDLTNNWPVHDELINFLQLDSHYTGPPIIHEYGDYFEFTSDPVPLVAGCNYRASAYLYVHCWAGSTGNHMSGGHAIAVFAPHEHNFAGQHYFTNGFAQVVRLTVADANPDLTPPTTVFEPQFTPDPCSPVVAGVLSSSDNSGGYGLDTVYWRYPGGTWEPYDGRQFEAILDDLRLEFHGVDIVGNVEPVRTYVHDYVPEEPLLLAPASGAPLLCESVVLQWEPRADYFDEFVQVGTDPGFGTCVFQQQDPGTNALVTGLVPGTPYFWRAHSRHDSCGTWGPWSEVREFTVADVDLAAVAFGDDAQQQCGIPYPNHALVGLAAGEDHTLVLQPGGTVVAVGDDGEGQCQVPAPNADFVAVAAGAIHSLGLKADGTVVPWGDARFDLHDVPAPNAGFVRIACGRRHALALRRDGSLAAWGDNGDGQCDVPAPNEGFIGMAGARRHSLGLKADGAVVGWGHDGAGQLDVPAPNADFVAVAAGEYHSLGLKADGSIVAWGANGAGQCDVPAPNANYVAIAAGRVNSAALRDDGTLVVWGDDAHGQTTVPGTNGGFRAVACGAGHVVALQEWDGVSAAADDPAPALPRRLAIARATPNPFNPRTTLWIDVPDAGALTVRVYDLRGRLVRTLASGSLPAGRHPVTWDGRDGAGRTVPAGVYFARAATTGETDTRKLVLVN